MSVRGVSLAVLAGVAVGAASAARPAGDPDVFWHLATARETLAHGLVRSDLFSWTVAGAPVSTDQWLGQLLLYAAYAADGWAGVVLARAAAIAFLVALLVATGMSATPRVRPLTAIVATLPAIFISTYVWSERPELFGLVCFAALLLLLRRGRDGSDRALAFVPALILAWANLHGSFALGVAIVALVSLEGALREPRRRAAYGLVTIASLAATLLTPAGLATWTAPGFHLLSPPRELQEWALPDPRSGIGALFAATVIVVAATALLARSFPLRDAIVLVPVGILAATAVRHTPLFAIAAAPFLAANAPPAVAALLARARLRVPHLAPPRPVSARGAVASYAAATLLGLAAILVAPRAPDESRYPAGAIAALPPGPGLFNHYDWGGWLIWTAPASPVFIDGRYTPYVGSVLDDYRQIIDARPGWLEALKRRGVRVVLARPGDAVVLRGIEMGWPVLARTPEAVLLRVP